MQMPSTNGLATASFKISIGLIRPVAIVILDNYFSAIPTAWKAGPRLFFIKAASCCAVITMLGLFPRTTAHSAV
jgi:hypothetical protein